MFPIGRAHLAALHFASCKRANTGFMTVRHLALQAAPQSTLTSLSLMPSVVIPKLKLRPSSLNLLRASGYCPVPLTTLLAWNVGQVATPNPVVDSLVTHWRLDLVLVWAVWHTSYISADDLLLNTLSLVISHNDTTIYSHYTHQSISCCNLYFVLFAVCTFCKKVCCKPAP